MCIYLYTYKKIFLNKKKNSTNSSVRGGGEEKKIQMVSFQLTSLEC